MPRRLLIPLVLGTLAGTWAFAQTAGEAEKQAIEVARRQAQEALERSKLLERQTKTAINEAVRARAESAALAARIEAAEADITSAEAQVRMIGRLQAEQQARLAQSQEPVARLMAALQTMGRRPPALALVQPGSLENMLHVRALLASTLPVVRARTAALRAELESANRLREQAQQAVAALRTSQEELRARRLALANFEAAQRSRSKSLAESALFQSDRALALTEEAGDMSAAFNTRQYRAQLEHELAELPGPLLRPGRTQRSAPPAQLRFRLPVEGQLIAGTGEISESGVHNRGIMLRTGGDQPVLAPANGRIVYAGPFRTYGFIVIIDHGRGWSSVVTNLGHLDVTVGSQVRSGERLGRTRSGKLPVSVELRHEGRPVPITPLLSPG